MNEQNLKPWTSANAAAAGRKGGLASGRARRRKAELKKSLEWALGATVEVNGEVLTVQDAVTQALIGQALQGNVRAFVTIRDTVEGKPVARQAVDADVKTITLSWQGDGDKA